MTFSSSARGLFLAIKGIDNGFDILNHNGNGAVRIVNELNDFRVIVEFSWYHELDAISQLEFLLGIFFLIFRHVVDCNVSRDFSFD